jgi:hypothetical protein
MLNVLYVLHDAWLWYFHYSIHWWEICFFSFIPAIIFTRELDLNVNVESVALCLQIYARLPDTILWWHWKLHRFSKWNVLYYFKNLKAMVISLTWILSLKLQALSFHKNRLNNRWLGYKIIKIKAQLRIENPFLEPRNSVFLVKVPQNSNNKKEERRKLKPQLLAVINLENELCCCCHTKKGLFRFHITIVMCVNFFFFISISIPTFYSFYLYVCQWMWDEVCMRYVDIETVSKNPQKYFTHPLLDKMHMYISTRLCLSLQSKEQDVNS